MQFENDFEDGFEASPWDAAEKKAAKAFELYEEGQTSEALELIDQAIEMDPTNGRWHFNKALALDSICEFEQAIEAYQAALEGSGDDTEILNCIAIDYTRIGCYDLAINAFERIELTKPDFEPAYCNRIITYTEMGNYEMAEQMFYQAQQLNENCPLCFYNLGNSFFIQGVYEKAIWCWKRTAEIEYSHPQINYRIAQGYWAIADNDNAFHYFIEELRANPGDVDVIFDFGIFLLHSGNVESATEKFKRIIEMHPDFAPALHYMGEIELSRQNTEKARELFERALSLDDELAGPQFRLAQMAIASGENEKALELLMKELQLDPSEPEIATAIGIMLFELGEFDYAMHCFLKASDLGSTDAINYIFMAKILSIRGDKKDAQQFLEYAMELCPGDAEIAKRVAMIYADMEKPEIAIEAVSFIENDFSVFAFKKKNQMKLAFKKTIDAVSHFKPSKK